MGKGGKNGCGAWLVLTRLLGSRRGNTFALIAGVIFPLLGLLGGGIDISRLYLTKTRLQHACDAGALAGRKAMGSVAWTTGANSHEATALAMFDGNFRQNDYGTGTRTRSYAESNGAVTGTATVDVPMTVMRVFGFTNRSLTVSCTAKMAIPNTDIMFVLDVTGSMNCVAGDTSCTNNGNVAAAGGKILGIKSAVKCFYEALMKVNTSEVCGDDPAATTYNGTAQIRMGFMPYSVNVNVGKLLPNSYLADIWEYQTRVATMTPPGTTTDDPYWQTYGSSISLNDCTKYINNQSPYGSSNPVNSGGPSPAATTSTTYSGNNGGTTANSGTEWGWWGASDTSGTSRSCRRRVTVATTTYVDTFASWTYKQAPLTVSGLKAGGSTWNGSVSLPIGSNGTDTSVTWDGCIEERKTVKNSDGDPSDEWTSIPSDAYDMNIDMVPTSDTDTQWGPMLDGAVWPRYSGGGSKTQSNYTTTSNGNYYGHPSDNLSYYCTTEAKKLQPWTTPEPFVTYVDSLTAIGNTYHDIGMLWGARFISPTGMFSGTNTNLSNIERHIIFMTDGDTMSFNDDYMAYGMSWWNRRQTTYAPSNGSGADTGKNSDTAKIINARLTALCTAIKNKNINLWVISYGGGINPTTESRLETCATSGKYFEADDTATLISNFKQIASSISQLRLTN